jgi:DNA-binding LytR/AlgR family response regulator
MKYLIIEDEEPASRNLRAILMDIAGVKPVSVLESIADTLEWFETNECPDIIFMDIHLADGSAFEIFNHVEIKCPVIFTTAYDKYALQAFKVNSIDYLLKPLNRIAVRNAIDKLKNISKSTLGFDDLKKIMSSIHTATNYKKSFLVYQKGDKLIPLYVNDIACIYIDAGVVKAITFAGKSFFIDHTLDEVSAMLDPKDYFRANRQFIISRNAIRDIDLWFNNRLSVNLKVALPEKILISKARLSVFKHWFTN